MRGRAKESRRFILVTAVLIAGLSAVLVLQACFGVSRGKARAARTETAVAERIADGSFLQSLDDLRLGWTADGVTFSAVLSRADAGTYRLAFEKPDEIAGLGLCYQPESGECTAEFLGMSAPLGGIFDGSEHLLGAVSAAFEDAGAGRAAVRASGDGAVVSGQAGKYAYRLSVDGSGRISGLSIPELGVACGGVSE